MGTHWLLKEWNVKRTARLNTSKHGIHCLSDTSWSKCDTSTCQDRRTMVGRSSWTARLAGLPSTAVKPQADPTVKRTPPKPVQCHLTLTIPDIVHMMMAAVGSGPAHECEALDWIWCCDGPPVLLQTRTVQSLCPSVKCLCTRMNKTCTCHYAQLVLKRNMRHSVNLWCLFIELKRKTKWRQITRGKSSIV